MKPFSNCFLVGILLCLAFIGSAFAQAPERDLAKEEKIWGQLQQTAPKAVETFKAATAALDAGDFQKSIELYNEVLSQDPTCEAALRRLGHALAASGNRFEGLKASQTAIDFNRTPANLISHAMTLAGFGTPNYKPTRDELEQAFSLSKEAWQKDTENEADYPLMVRGSRCKPSATANFKARPTP